MSQFFMALFGLTAMYLATGKNERLRKWAPIVGLCAQPFWFWFCWQTSSWGLAILSAAYTAVYIRGIVLHWRRA